MSTATATAIDIQQLLTRKELLDLFSESEPLKSSTALPQSRLQLVSAENSTQFIHKSRDIQIRIESLFASAREEIFEDGMQSQFSRHLLMLIRSYGNQAITALTDYILSERANAEVAAEALRWIGHINDPSTHRDRLWLLEKSLSSSSPRIRDGAGLGLAFLDDPHAIPYLIRAVERENYTELRADLKQVISQLGNTKQCRSF